MARSPSPLAPHGPAGPRPADVLQFPSSEVPLEDELRAIRTRVLNVVGHELRTPVTTLRGLAAALGSVDPLTAQEHVIPAIQRNTERLERLVDDLLIATGITTALPTGRPEPVEVAALVRSVWDELGGEPSLELGPPASFWALVPPGTLDRALRRVLENAVRLGNPPTTVTLSEEHGTITITVDSPGPALHPEEVHLARELLFRGEAAVVRAPGLGLGLPVAKALLEHAGGTLSVGARGGGGLVTVLTVPAGGTGR